MAGEYLPLKAAILKQSGATSPTGRRPDDDRSGRGGGFVWPRMTGYEGSITLSPAQLAMLIEGIDWRVPERIWRPALAG